MVSAEPAGYPSAMATKRPPVALEGFAAGPPRGASRQSIPGNDARHKLARQVGRPSSSHVSRVRSFATCAPPTPGTPWALPPQRGSVPPPRAPPSTLRDAKAIELIRYPIIVLIVLFSLQGKFPSVPL